MEKGRVRQIIEPLLESLAPEELEIEIKDNNIRIEIVSEAFKGIHIIPRMEMVSKLMTPLHTSNLYEFILSIIPVTHAEKYNNANETSGDMSKIKSVQVQMRKSTLDDINELRTLTGTANRSEIVKTAIDIAKLAIETINRGGKLIIEEKNGERRNIIIHGVKKV